MLESMTPRQFDEWLQEYDRRPWDGGWVPHGEPQEETQPADSLSAFRSMAGF
jgi:hypothetical protein